MNRTQKQHFPKSASIRSGFPSRVLCLLILSFLLPQFAAAGSERQPRTPIADGHWDLGVDFNWVDESQPTLGGEWEFFLWSPERQERTSLDQIYFVVDDRYKSPIPSGGSWQQVLGQAGSPSWTLPQTARPGEIYLGFRIFPQPAVSFKGRTAADSNGTIRIELVDIEGSGIGNDGDYVMYELAGVATSPDPSSIYFSTRTDDRFLELPVALASPSQTHAHYAWAMTAPGRYEAVFEISATIRSTGEVVTGEGRVVFQVNEGVGPPSGFAAIDSSNFPWVWHHEMGWMYWFSRENNEGWLVDIEGRPYFWMQHQGYTIMNAPMRGNWWILR